MAKNNKVVENEIHYGSYQSGLVVSQVELKYFEDSDSVCLLVLTEEGDILEKIDVDDSFFSCLINRWKDQSQAFKLEDKRYKVSVEELKGLAGYIPPGSDTPLLKVVSREEFFDRRLARFVSEIKKEIDHLNYLDRNLKSLFEEIDEVIDKTEKEWLFNKEEKDAD